MYGDLPVIMIDALYCRSTAVLLAMHVWLYVVAVLYMVSGAGRPRGARWYCAGRPPGGGRDASLGAQAEGLLRRVTRADPDVYSPRRVVRSQAGAVAAEWRRS